jgi:type IV secretion system protein VirB8
VSNNVIGVPPGDSPPAVLTDVSAREWEYIAHGAVLVERNRWFVGTIVAGLIAVAAVAAIILLLPLQRLVPMAVTIDSRSGLVTSVEYGRSVAELTQKEAVQRSDVAKYVVARETYDPVDLATATKTVLVMSDANVWRQYEEETSQFNESSTARRYGAKLRRRVEISTVVPLPDSTHAYQVRYVVVEEYPGSQTQPVERPYVSTVSFRYSERPLSNEDRILNPLNFRATGYRRDQELTNSVNRQSKGMTP